ncbi:MAG: hypothetical protein ACQGVK_21410 [Myxococcota bacterium]
MKKADIDARMADYLEGDLPLEDRALFDAHLDADAESAREVAELRQTIELLRSLPDPETPADLGDRVMARIRAGEARGSWLERLTESLSSWLSPQWAVPLGAAAALVLLAVVSGDLRIGPRESGLSASPEGSGLDLARESTGRAAPGPVDRPGVPAPLPPTERVARAEPPAPPTSSPVAPEVPSGTEVASADPSATPGSTGSLRPLARAPLTPAPLVAVSNPLDAQPRTGVLELGAPRGPSDAVLRSTTGTMGASAFDGPLTPEQSEERRNAQLAPMLDALFENPDALAAFLQDRAAGELENWGKELARYAVERGEAQRAHDAVAAHPALDVGPFVSAFQTQIASLRTDVVAREADAEAQPARAPAE